MISNDVWSNRKSECLARLCITYHYEPQDKILLLNKCNFDIFKKNFKVGYGHMYSCKIWQGCLAS